MHYRLRKPRNDRRSSRPSRRYLGGRDEFNHKNEVAFKQAGKLAAEYLVSIGMFPESSLRPKREANGRFDEFKRRSYRRNDDDDDDDDDGYNGRRGKRRWDGGYGSNFRGEKRQGRRGRGRGRGRDWGGDGIHCEKHQRWLHDGPSRSVDMDLLGLEDRGSFGGLGLNNVGGGEGGVENGENRDDEVMSYESGEVRDDDFGVETFEVGGGSGNGVDLLELCRFVGVPNKPRTKRGKGKGSLRDGRKSLSEFTFDLNKVPSDSGLESDGEVKIEISGDLKEKSLCKAFDVAKTCHLSEDDADPVKLCRSINFPTKPRTSCGRRTPRIPELLATKAEKIVENESEVPKVIEGGDIMVDAMSESLPNQSNISEGKEISISSITSTWKINGQEEIKFLGQPLEPQLFEGFLTGEEMVTRHVIDQVKSVNDDSCQMVLPELNIKMEVEQQLQRTLFKVCDLNLTAPSEMPLEVIKAQDDLASNYHTSDPIFEASKEVPVGFGRMMGNTSININDYFQLSGHGMIPAIDLEDDSSIESNDYDSPKPKSKVTYSCSMNLIENEDRHGSNGGSSDAVSELHLTDTFGGSLAPSDLKRPDTGMEIANAEVPSKLETS